jgi:uncharacterized protein YbjT (DUF2867 family)
LNDEQFCVVGATHGLGLLITRQLLASGAAVRVLARDPDKARRLFGNGVHLRQGDVTDASSVRAVLARDDLAIFFTVAATGGMDGRGLFASEATIRDVTYQGLLNVVDSARAVGFTGRFILPSVVGADRSSLVIRILDQLKRGLWRDLRERERYLRASGLDYTIVRAPILTNGPDGESNIRISKAVRKLTAGPKISRGDLARVLILVSRQPAASRKTFDLFSAKGVVPTDQQLLAQLEQIPVD